MSIDVVCPTCEARSRCDEHYVGRRARCAGCGHRFLIEVERNTDGDRLREDEIMAFLSEPEPRRSVCQHRPHTAEESGHQKKVGISPAPANQAGDVHRDVCEVENANSRHVTVFSEFPPVVVSPCEADSVIAPIIDMPPIGPKSVTGWAGGFHAPMPGWLRVAHFSLRIIRNISLVFAVPLSLVAVLCICGLAIDFVARGLRFDPGLGIISSVVSGLCAGYWGMFFLSRQSIRNLENGDTLLALAAGVLAMPTIWGILVLIGIHTEKSKAWCQRQIKAAMASRREPRWHRDVEMEHGSSVIPPKTRP